jgi:hypothetical protein
MASFGKIGKVKMKKYEKYLTDKLDEFIEGGAVHKSIDAINTYFADKKAAKYECASCGKSFKNPESNKKGELVSPCCKGTYTKKS